MDSAAEEGFSTHAELLGQFEMFWFVVALIVATKLFDIREPKCSCCGEPVLRVLEAEGRLP